VNDEHVEEELLNRYFDGDLAAASASEVTRHLETCVSCASKHRALGELRRLIGIAAEHGSHGQDFDALFGRIEQSTRTQAAPGLGERVSFAIRDRVSSRSRQVFMPAVAGALAAAAALVLILRPGPSSAPPQEPSAAGPNVETAALTSAGSSEVEQVDFGAKTGTVFHIALSEGISTHVVWIDDDDEPGME
jgi:anti-sigma factor RsiW